MLLDAKWESTVSCDQEGRPCRGSRFVVPFSVALFHSRRAALMSFKAGDKQGAFRYVRQSKLFSESRNKCTQLLERVEEVISLIASAESTKQVYEAIQIGMKAMKEHNVSIEDINTHLKEVDDLVAAQRKINVALDFCALHTMALFGGSPLHDSAPGAAGAVVENHGVGKEVLRRSLYSAELVECRTWPIYIGLWATEATFFLLLNL
ncbi:hypothetical protein ACQJBY_021876 [Aegilops geniculata]